MMGVCFVVEDVVISEQIPSKAITEVRSSLAANYLILVLKFFSAKQTQVSAKSEEADVISPFGPLSGQMITVRIFFPFFS
jgi:hypothetical protein